MEISTDCKISLVLVSIIIIVNKVFEDKNIYEQIARYLITKLYTYKQKRFECPSLSRRREGQNRLHAIYLRSL